MSHCLPSADCCWARSTSRSGQCNRTRRVVPAAWSLGAPCSEVLSVLGPGNISEVVFQRTFSFPPHRAWPRSRTPRVYIVILPLGLAASSTWRLSPPLVPTSTTIGSTRSYGPRGRGAYSCSRGLPRGPLCCPVHDPAQPSQPFPPLSWPPEGSEHAILTTPLTCSRP